MGALLCAGALLATTVGPVTAAADEGGDGQGAPTAAYDVVRPFDWEPDPPVQVRMRSSSEAPSQQQQQESQYSPS